MGGIARMNRKRLDQFLNCWEPLFKQVPETRKKAVEAMGEAMQKNLNAKIRQADLESDAKDTVVSWQELRIGSGGGYAAVSPQKGVAPPKSNQKQHTWNGEAVRKKQVTRWLERGHGVPSADMTKSYAWSEKRRIREGKSRLNARTGRRFVAGRQFYSFAKLNALDEALRAADKVLSVIADEVDY